MPNDSKMRDGAASATARLRYCEEHKRACEECSNCKTYSYCPECDQCHSPDCADS